MKKKVLYTLVLGVLFASVTSVGVSASEGRAGLYSKPAEKVEAAESSSVSAEAAGLYSPLRANPTNPGEPGWGEGIGTVTPIGDATGLILLAGVAYLGFVFLRKRKKSLIAQ